MSAVDIPRCPACAAYVHGSCRRYLHALGVTADPVWQRCGCGCRYAPDSPYLTRAALQEMAEHGTLVDYVAGRQAAETSSLRFHFGTPCRACADRVAHTAGIQGTLL